MQHTPLLSSQKSTETIIYTCVKRHLLCQLQKTEVHQNESIQIANDFPQLNFSFNRSENTTISLEVEKHLSQWPLKKNNYSLSWDLTRNVFMFNRKRLKLSGNVLIQFYHCWLELCPWQNLTHLVGLQVLPNLFVQIKSIKKNFSQDPLRASNSFSFASL